MSSSDSGMSSPEPETTSPEDQHRIIISDIVKSQRQFLQSDAPAELKDLLHQITRTGLHITKCIYIDPMPLFQAQEYEEENKGRWRFTLFNWVRANLRELQHTRMESYAYFYDHTADNDVDRGIFANMGVKIIPEIAEPQRIVDENTLLFMPFVHHDTIGEYLQNTNPGIIVMNGTEAIASRLQSSHLESVTTYRNKMRRGEISTPIERYWPVQRALARYQAVDRSVRNGYVMSDVPSVECEYYEALENLFVYYKKVEWVSDGRDLVSQLAALDWCNIFRVLTAGMRY